MDATIGFQDTIAWPRPRAASGATTRHDPRTRHVAAAIALAAAILAALAGGIIDGAPGGPPAGPVPIPLPGPDIVL